MLFGTCPCKAASLASKVAICQRWITLSQLKPAFVLSLIKCVRSESRKSYYLSYHLILTSLQRYSFIKIALFGIKRTQLLFLRRRFISDYKRERSRKSFLLEKLIRFVRQSSLKTHFPACDRKENSGKKLTYCALQRLLRWCQRFLINC